MKTFNLVLLLLGILSLGWSPQGYAQSEGHHSEPTTHNPETVEAKKSSENDSALQKSVASKGSQAQQKVPTCASVELAEGDVQILSQSKKELVELRRKAAVPCGSWISTNEGWVQLKHTSGPLLHLAPGTYIQILQDSSSSDQLVVFRGQVYADVSGTHQSFKLGSAAGRARVERGKVVFLTGYAEKAASQLIVLEDSALFENRFEPGKQVRVDGGEVSEVSFDLLRVIPTDPSPIAVATLKPIFFELHVDEKVQSKAFMTVAKRQARSLPEIQVAKESSKTPKRKLASIKLEKGSKNLPQNEKSPSLQRHFLEQMAPGVKDADELIYPGRKRLKPQLNVSPQLNQKESEEKKLILEELGRIQVE